MSLKPSLPQGTRDFSSEIVYMRAFIFNTIKSVFELYGFQPLETPAMENVETLMGKYGEEGDKLIFKILNNGLDNPNKAEATKKGFENILEGKTDKSITERALRYDLTIPFARYVAMNRGTLTFPYKRFQIQPVWRADKPQRGRYREFYQCDADVVGSNSLLYEVELAQIYATAFDKLKVPVEIHINSRKLLTALAELCGAQDKLTSITIAIDKLDKIGLEKVKAELLGRGLLEHQVAIVEKYLSIDGDNSSKLAQLANLVDGNESAIAGLKEIQFLLGHLTEEMQASIVVDQTLARGLDYYTGIIFEVKAKDVQMGSIGGGGRYDNLTGLFGVDGISGVGVSFGIDRIYDVMDELQLFPEDASKSCNILILNLGEEEGRVAFSIATSLRSHGIPAEVYPDITKFDKQFNYGKKKNFQYLVIVEENELSDNTCKIKDMKYNKQETISINDLISFFESK
ncbi:MAG: histidine--tRNA ligase [Pseudopedobacter saltans]|uniref:Histidine--tRNA ligase n=1 Tax=Pseudopedobacter saltans TaxID=151895 RepID=A0A2W5H5W5_9SPHI|nr:MAG: histidine--tRNA ligase [Pseudopedobacter saltans]